MKWLTTAHLVVPLLIFASGTASHRHNLQGANLREQSIFYEEPPDGIRIKRPIPVPRAVLDTLKHDDGVSSCLANEHLSPGELPSSWFVSSEIHLDGSRETDLVVEPNLSDESRGQNACFLGANTMQFWVFAKPAGRYELVLSVRAGSLEILDTKSKRYRDIKAVWLSSAATHTTAIFRFDGKQYQLHKSETLRNR